MPSAEPARERMENPDHQLIAAMVRDGLTSATVETNAFARTLGTKILELDAARSSLRLQFSVPAFFVQGGGFVQGGAIAGMLDFAMAFAAMMVIEEGLPFSTTNLHVDFLSPASAEGFEASARILKAGKRLVFVEADLHSSRMVASARSTIMIASKP